jgi:hypothetical protein
MDVNDQIDKLKKLDNNRLIDVVKNYRQYGYNEELRTIAMLILEDRGVTIEELALAGNLTNATYESATSIYRSYRLNSILAFVMYVLMILGAFRVLPLMGPYGALEDYALGIQIGIIVLYFVFLVRSFLDQSQFYKTTGEKYGVDGALLYLFLGMPFYFFMFLYFRNQMKEKMKLIR